MVCVPMNVGDKTVGVIQILNKRLGNYTERDGKLLEHFAAQSAIAICNARLFEDLLAHMGFYTSRDETKSPRELLDEIKSPARPEELSILFADMRGFTQLCQSVDGPAVVQKVLDEFLGMLAGEVLLHRGIVNKFLGDGVMALFRDDIQGDKSFRAVQCAFGMLDRFDTLYKQWKRSPSLASVALDELDLGIGIGITTGNVIIGSVGSNRVRDFTPIGIAVNLAGYLMERARGEKRIIVDGSTYLAVADLVAECSGPTSFIYRKHDHDKGGRPLVYYHVKSLKSHPGLPATGSPTNLPSTRPVCDVFVSYSHKDADWLAKLKTHLTPFVRGGVSFWDDTKIRSGDVWREEIKKALQAAKVAVLLVSPDFLDSDFIFKNELPPLLDAAKNRALRVLWVPVSYSSVDETEISKYQAAFSPSRPLKGLSDVEQDRVLVQLCKDIREAIQP
jgi:adenylate cyclase